jgi:acyl carrier protein
MGRLGVESAAELLNSRRRIGRPLASCALEPLEQSTMEMLNEVLQMLDDVLGLGGRALHFTADTALLGSLPELDSMAVVALVNGMEDRFGISVSDDEISGDTFATVGSLTAYLSSKA